MQHARLILDGKHQGGFVIAARFGMQLPNDHKSRDIIALIFDVRGHRLQIVNFPGHDAGDCCQGTVRGGFHCRMSRACDLIDRDRWEVAREPAAALRQCLWMRDNPFYIGWSTGARQ